MSSDDSSSSSSTTARSRHAVVVGDTEAGPRVSDDSSDTPPTPDAQPDESKAAPISYAPAVFFKRRWLMLAFLCLVSFTNSTMVLCFTPMAEEAAAHYDVDINLINALVAMGDAMSVVAIFILPYFVDQRGLFISTIILHFVNVIGGWLRFAGFPGQTGFFAPLFSGQAMCMVAMFFCIQLSPRLAATWFPPSQRTVAIAMQTVCMMAGLIVGIVLGSVLRHLLWVLLLIQAIINTPPAVGIFFTHDKPPVPSNEPTNEADLEKDELHKRRCPCLPRDSEAAEGSPTVRDRLKSCCCCCCTKSGPGESEIRQLLRATKLLLTNKFFVALIFSNGIPQGIASVTLTLIQQLLPDNMQSYAALFSSLFLGSAILGSLVLSTLASKTKWYYRICATCLVVTCFTFLGFFLCAVFHQMIVAIVFFTITGFFQFGLLPVSTDYAVEVSYVKGMNLEGRSTAFLWLVLNLTSVVLTFGTQPTFMPAWSSLLVYQILLVICAIVCLLLFRAPYRRLEAEAEEAAQNKANELEATKVEVEGTSQDEKELTREGSTDGSTDSIKEGTEPPTTPTAGECTDTDVLVPATAL
eukprot:TRINITY_DN5893_c0_g3_i1.p1 TRINITY_DN5893_c0_g3~~TRINITY_DN5893_c0_g3_i1.p1  ORF type:complete len:581 (+),score=122.76 TRINITY_DN5893_c0_g3_i1:688-2430(+)